eukprot:10944371-Ditylum_brightwellii.AAC.2
MCDTKNSDVCNNSQKPYYSKVEVWSSVNGYQIGLGGSYEHAFKPVKIKEHVNWDSCIIRDGVRGGRNGAIYRLWQQGTDYDDVMEMSMNYVHFLQIKCTRILCNNDSAKKKGEDGYNPAYKYDYIYDVLCHNVNALTCHADLNLCGDETTFGHNGYGEPG